MIRVIVLEHCWFFKVLFFRHKESLSLRLSITYNSLVAYTFFFFFFFLVASGLSCSRQTPQLQQAGSLVVPCELLVVARMWALVPGPGIKPGPPALGAQRLNHCATREVLAYTSVNRNKTLIFSPYLIPPEFRNSY